MKGILYLEKPSVAYIALLIAGALTTFSYPPFNFMPINFLCFSCLLGIVFVSKTRLNAFLAGFIFYLSYIYTGLSWLSINLVSHLTHNPIVFLVVIIIIPVSVAILYGFSTLLTYVIPVKLYASKIIIFSILWTLSSWFVGRVFPETLGDVWGNNLAILQSVAYTGIYGLTFFSLILFSCPVLLVMGKNDRINIALPGLIIAIFIGFYWLGHYRLNSASAEIIPDLKIRLINPGGGDSKNLAESDKKLANLIALSHQKLTPDIRLIVWPEGNYMPIWIPQAAPDSIFRKNLAKASGAAPKNGAVIINVDKVTLKPDILPNKFRYSQSDTAVLNNTALVITSPQNVLDYDQTILFPFAEYNPLAQLVGIPKLLDFLNSSRGNIEYSPGKKRTTVHIFNIPAFSILICYEAILPGKIVLTPENRPKWLLVLSSDSWFLGFKDMGLYRHYQFVRERSIEEGLPIVKATNDGISVVFDSYGRIFNQLHPGQSSYMDTFIPHELDKPGLYARHGDWMLGLILILSLVLVLFMEKKAKASKT